MSTLKTAGELRSFLADVLVDIRESRIDATKAGAIAKVAAQINQSLMTEVSTALQMEKMGKPTGQMLLGGPSDDVVELEPPATEEPNRAASPRAVVLPPPSPTIDGKTWCAQCEERVSQAKADACEKRFCKARAI